MFVKYKSKIRIKGLSIRQGSNIKRYCLRSVKRLSLGDWRRMSQRSSVVNTVHQATVCNGW